MHATPAMEDDTENETVLVPLMVYYSYTPCASCEMYADKGKCDTCTLNLCSFCASFHDCSGGPFEDSRCPTPGNHLESQQPVEDGASSESASTFTPPASNELYVRLMDTWSKIWAPLVAVDEHIYLRVRHLQPLSTALIYDSEADAEPRQFGMQNDWKRLMFQMNWDATGFVVVCLNRQRCALFIPGQPYPDIIDIKRGLELLVNQRKMIGFGERVVDGWKEFAHIEVWRHPGEGFSEQTETNTDVCKTITILIFFFCLQDLGRPRRTLTGACTVWNEA